LSKIQKVLEEEEKVVVVAGAVAEAAMDHPLICADLEDAFRQSSVIYSV
jgi:ribosomal protein L18E